MVTRVPASMLLEPVNVKANGVRGDGIADDTAAIQALANTVGANGALFFPKGQYRITSAISVPFSRQRWVGEGRGATRLVFAPTANGVMLQFGVNGSTLTSQSSLEHMTLTSGDATFNKTAVEVYDHSTFVMRDVEITGTVSAGGTLAWTGGGGGGSIGVRTFGREAPRFEGGCYISADNPIRLSRNPHVTVPRIDSDFYSLRNLYTIAFNQPNILIDSDVEVLNFLADGCPFVRGTHAVKWVGSGTTQSVPTFAILNSRFEQPQDPTAFALDIQPAVNMYGFLLDGFSFPDGVNGLRLRNARGPVLRNVLCNQNAGETVLDVDGTVLMMRHDNCLWGTNTVASMVGQRTVWAANKVATAEPLPWNALYDRDTSTAFGQFFDGPLNGRRITLAAGAEFNLGPTVRGMLSVTDGGGTGSAIFLLTGGSQALVAQVGTAWAAGYGSGSLLNVGWDGSTYKVENRTAGTKNIAFALIGASASF